MDPMSERLFLPEVLCGCVGMEMNVYFANVFASVNPANHFFRFRCGIGRCDEKRWRCVPDAQMAGVHEARLQVMDDNGIAAEGSARITVTDPEEFRGRRLRLLMIGDSLTDQTHYPAHLLALCRRFGLEVTMLGTNVPAELRTQPGQLIRYPEPALLEGVRHEGWGGWTAWSFLTKKKPDECVPFHHWNGPSPFLDEAGNFDFGRYLEKHCGGTVPEMILIGLGGNDLAAIEDENKEPLAARFLEGMEQLYAGVRRDAPEALIGIVLNPWGARSQDAWGSNYGSRRFAWDKRRLVPGVYRRLADRFAPRPRTFIVPLFPAIDPEHGYPEQEEPLSAEDPAKVIRQSNALHPSPAGYRQMADTAFAFMLHALKRSPNKTE